MFDAGPLPTNLPSSTTEITCSACGYTVSSILCSFFVRHVVFGPRMDATSLSYWPQRFTTGTPVRPVPINFVPVQRVPTPPIPLPRCPPLSTAVQGSLPSELGLLTAVTAVRLASNSLTGVVPSGACKSARVRVCGHHGAAFLRTRRPTRVTAAPPPQKSEA